MRPKRSWQVWAAVLLAAMAGPGLVTHPALAHVSGTHAAAGLVAGFAHPLAGADHVMAMVAVGLWGAFLGAPAVWLLPVVFPLIMALGGAAGAAGLGLPYVEVGIALSAVVLGLMVAGAVNAPLWLAAIVVGAFAVFHGHAHGTELPGGASALAYSAGFVVATGLLHLAGIALSTLTRLPAGIWLVRAGGAGISVAGILILVRHLA
jgi:urease accessory protein